MSNIDKYETRKKMVYDFMCDDMYVPMRIKELCIVLGVKKEDRPQLEQILLDLQAEGRITLSKRGKYSKSEIKKTVGVFTAHQRGFGFVTVEGCCFPHHIHRLRQHRTAFPSLSGHMPAAPA